MWVGYERGRASKATLSHGEWFGFVSSVGIYILMRSLHFLTFLWQSSAADTLVIQNNGFHDMSSELQVLQEQLKARDAKIVELEKEAALLRDEKTMIQLEVRILQVGI